MTTPLSSTSRQPSSKPKYQYNPLDKGHIRLLVLLPGAFESPIRCLLQTVNLLDFNDITGIAPASSLSAYEALSYAWSQSKAAAADIDCNGCMLQITGSLVEALRYLRDVEKSRILWADGICINQCDFQERAEQVKLMGLIYWKARKVVVWLGCDDDEEQLKASNAFWLLQKLCQLYRQRRDVIKAISDVRKYGEEEIRRGDDSSNWESLRRLLNRKWFTRVWVVQELGLANAAMFQCGSAAIHFDDFKDAYSYIELEVPMAITYYRLNVRMLDLTDAYTSSTRGHYRPELGSDPNLAETFLSVLDLAKGLQYTDPRDLVFAFLGHPSAFKKHLLDPVPYEWYPRNVYEQRNPVIEPDYSEETSALDVYFRLAFTIIEDLNLGLELLYHTGHNEETIQEDFPSWVPRWDSNEECTFPKGAISSYNASLEFSPTRFEVLLDPEDEFVGLQLQAYHVDIVQFFSQLPSWHYFEPLSNINMDTQQHWEWPANNENPVELMHANLEELRSSLPNPSFNDVTSFAITLTAGLRNISADSSQHLEKFKAYVQAKAADNLTLKRTKNDDSSQSNNPNNYLGALRSVAPCRNFFGTVNGRLGLGPRITQGGDQLWLPMGSKMPFVLRPHLEGRFKILGPAYLHGIMGGEAIKDLGVDDFTLITLC